MALGKELDPEQPSLGKGLDAEDRPHGARPMATAEPPASADQRSMVRRVSRRVSAAEAESLLAPIGSLYLSIWPRLV